MSIGLTTLVFMAFIIMTSSAAVAQPEIISVRPGGSIQMAIELARPGDTVVVHGGTYYEHIKVDRSIVLKGIEGPILDATASGSAITLVAGGITLEGFEVINAGSWPEDETDEAGIKVLSDNNVIRGNRACNNANGIVLVNARNNTITGNDASYNLRMGIILRGCQNNTLSRNRLYNNGKCNAYDDGINIWDDDEGAFL